MSKTEKIKIVIPANTFGMIGHELGDKGFVPNSSSDIAFYSEGDAIYQFSIGTNETRSYMSIFKLVDGVPEAYSPEYDFLGEHKFEGKMFVITKEGQG